jgi:hypothetical protein
MEQTIWRELYDGLTDELRKSSPDLMATIEPVEHRRQIVENLQRTMAAKLKAHPNDYGKKAWWGFVIIGLLVGWMRSPDGATILVYGLAFSIAGVFFAVFGIDSAEVQSKVVHSRHSRSL